LVEMTHKLIFVAILGTLALAGGSARALSSSLVISEVYGGGGNTGAPYANDFIELRNISASPVMLSGWSVQYASATGSAWAVTPLTAVTLSPGRYFLIQEASGGTNGSPLPAPDTIGTIGLAVGAGKVALVASTTPLTGVCPPGAVDLVGYGTANCFEGMGPAPAPSNTLSDQRGNHGRAETDDNSFDFEVLAPEPQNTTSPSAVTVRSIGARAVRDAVVLRWQTGAEIGLLGFDVYRLRAGTRVKLNAELILARGGVSGHAYTYRVTRAVPRSRYALRAIEADGRRSWVAVARR
jgi:predicted extracellular nuclease